jgi:hypothetical protein
VRYKRSAAQWRALLLRRGARENPEPNIYYAHRRYPGDELQPFDPTEYDLIAVIWTSKYWTGDLEAYYRLCDSGDYDPREFYSPTRIYVEAASEMERDGWTVGGEGLGFAYQKLFASRRRDAPRPADQTSLTAYCVGGRA